jgi:23S rRNA (cytosine1962-C5)-methyltransferase
MFSILSRLERSLAARSAFFDSHHDTALRLFNGFLEGYPGLLMDVYASTLVVFNLAKSPESIQSDIYEGINFVQNCMPWLNCVLLKTRYALTHDERCGQMLAGDSPDRKVCEHGVWFALNLRINQDAGLYLDTRNLRKWAFENLAGRSVLNTFAYTGSLGVAAVAGGACRVIHLDLNHDFLNLATASYALNGFKVQKANFIVGDFWTQVSRMRRVGETFDCIFIDPPFFSTTSRGRLDMNTDTARLINKLRPLVTNGGWLAVVNNALFVSGKEYLAALEALCADGYLKIIDLIPVPEDFTGFKETRICVPITDPSPFNHSTKIALLEVRRKEEEGE